MAINYTFSKIEDAELKQVLFDFATYKGLEKTGAILTISSGQYFVGMYNDVAYKMTPHKE